MCGSEAELVKALIEGAEMTVCESCARFGKVLDAPQRPVLSPGIPGRARGSSFSPSRPSPMPRRKEIIQVIVPDYAQKIRKARERLGLTQEEFSKKLQERESLMQKIESGQFQPSIATARKLEKILKVRLIDQVEDGNVPISSTKSDSEGMTLGDFIKDKRS
ncbi:TPA: TIGR00270 family protein [Candidatus Woesearchaeota archaeon]|nr:TIGR00270 family protein [Candidatus Woesearchaeota archaeon]